MRLMIVVGTAMLATVQLTGCSSSGEPGPQPTTTEVSVSDEVVPGYTGGCKEGFTLYVQNQFSVAKGVYGTLIRRSLDFVNTRAESVGLKPNDELRAIGWTNVGDAFNKDHPDYARNPVGLRAEVWFYVLELPGGPGWVPDAGVRAVPTTPAPGDEDKYFDPATQAAPQSPECELSPR